MLAQSLDLFEIGKMIGSLGSTTLLGIAVYVLWGKLQKAQDKLDEFQEARIAEQKSLIAALTTTASTGGKP